MKAFVNRDDLTFDEADEQEATQTWDLAEGGAEARATPAVRKVATRSRRWRPTTLC